MAPERHHFPIGHNGSKHVGALQLDWGLGPHHGRTRSALMIGSARSARNDPARAFDDGLVDDHAAIELHGTLG
jgi:hypothetical protein